jgi:hypothetical protein
VAKRHRCAHRRRPPKESTMVILVPMVCGKEELTADIRADDGDLAVSYSDQDGGRNLRFSGIELHTAMHALGFVRLNDRDGYG